MIPYFVIFISISIFSFFIDFSKSRLIRFLLYLPIFFLFISLYYFREASIGTDTVNYIRIFQDIIRTHNIVEYSLDKNIEIGFSFAVYFLSLFSHNYFFIFAGLTSIVYINLIIAINNFKLNNVLSFASLFCVFQIYFQSFNILRQAIALSFAILAVSYLLNSNNKKFLILCFMAFLFHYSSVLIFLFFFVYKFRNKIVRYWYVSVFGSFFILGFLFNFLIVSYDKYNAYDVADDITNSGGVLINLFYIIIFASSLFLKRKITYMTTEFFLFLAIFGFYISLKLFFLTSPFLNQAMVRISLYFLWPSVFIMLVIFKNIRNNDTRYLINCCYYIFLFSFTTYFLSNAGYELVPYRFR